MFSSLFKYVTNDVISYGLISIMAPTKDQCCEVVKLNYKSIGDHLKKVVKTMKKKPLRPRTVKYQTDTANCKAI